MTSADGGGGGAVISAVVTRSLRILVPEPDIHQVTQRAVFRGVLVTFCEKAEPNQFSAPGEQDFAADARKARAERDS